MGRQCSCIGCRNTFGLHSFPADVNIRRQWFRALGLPERDLPLRAGVCNRHFSRDCFSNLMEVEMGFTKVLLLKSNAVPNVALPVPTTPSTMRPPPRKLQPKLTREIGCQTEPDSTKHAAEQSSKATQAPTSNRSMSCDIGTSRAAPEALENPGIPWESFTPVRCTKCEVSADDSGDQLDVTDSTMKCTSTSNELPPHTVTEYTVHEDKLMELFKRCPVCTRSCEISKTVSGSLLQVKQSCNHCKYFHQWSSQPVVNNVPAENLQLCAAVLITGSSFVQISEFMDASKIKGMSETTFHKHQDDLRDARAGGDVTPGGDVHADSPELPHQHVCKEEEVPGNQERNSSLDQEDPEPPQIKKEQEEPEPPQIKEEQEQPEPPQIKEEQEELWPSQEGEQLELRQETDAFMFTPTPCRVSYHIAESQDQNGGKRRDSGSTRNTEPKPKKRHHKSRSHSNNVHNLSETDCKTHTGKKSFQCGTCGKDFDCKSRLQTHLISHTGEKPYHCKTCWKRFGYMSALKKYVRVHTGEKPYSCKTCGKTFSWIPYLKNHTKIHTGEKPHSCKPCGKGFRFSSSLLGHMRIHSGWKPFTWKTCGRAFRYSADFKVDTRTHTSENLYLCKTCGKSDLNVSHLAAHQRSHTDK